VLAIESFTHRPPSLIADATIELATHLSRDSGFALVDNLARYLYSLINQHMHKAIIAVASLPLLAAALVSADAAAEPARAVEAGINEETDFEKARESRASLAEADKKLKPILAADRRVAPLSKEIHEALNHPDKAVRKQKLEVLKPRIIAIKSDALKKAGIAQAEIDQKVEMSRAASLKLVRVEPQQAEPPPGPGTVISSVTVNSFPDKSGSKNDCPDDDDKYDFEGGATVKVHAESSPVDADCWGIKAGRGATVQVPPGTKKIGISYSAFIDLWVGAVPFGWMAEAKGYFGVAVRSPNGVKLANGSTTIKKELKVVHAYSFGPLPFDFGGFEEDIQSGEQLSNLTFKFDNDPGTSLRISIYTGGWADADLTGDAVLNNKIVPKSMKVTFFR